MKLKNKSLTLIHTKENLGNHVLNEMKKLPLEKKKLYYEKQISRRN